MGPCCLNTDPDLCCKSLQFMNSGNQQENRDYMRSEVSAFRVSGQTIKEFAKGKPYTHHKLAYWSAKIKKEVIKGSDCIDTGFVALKPVLGSSKSTLMAEIVCPNGIRVNIYEPISASFIKSLL